MIYNVSYQNEEIEIRLASKLKSGLVHRYELHYFDIILKSTKERIGYIDLRVGYTDYLYYLGNVGYRVYEEYRGHRYAYQACVLLFEYAKHLELPYLIITCDPDNIASKKTLERLPGEYLGEKKVPITHPMFLQGEKIKCIYRYDIL